MLSGVQFRKGALIFLLVDSIHHDPNVWTEPEEFNPERYSQSVIPTAQVLRYGIHLYCCIAYENLSCSLRYYFTNPPFYTESLSARLSSSHSPHYTFSYIQQSLPKSTRADQCLLDMQSGLP